MLEEVAREKGVEPAAIEVWFADAGLILSAKSGDLHQGGEARHACSGAG